MTRTTHGERCGGLSVRVAAWALVGVALAAVRAAWAQDLAGYVQVQYHRIEQSRTIVEDGLSRRITSWTDLWTHSYELNHTARLLEGLSLYSRLQWDEQFRPGTSERSRSPYGSLRLSHRWFGVSGSHRPIEATTSLAGQPGFLDPGTSAEELAVTTRQQETLLGAYFAAPRLPRLDVGWARRHRDRDELLSEETGITRAANLSYDLGGFYLRGGYSDFARGQSDVTAADVEQRNYNAGSGLQLGLGSRLAVSLGYDFTQVDRGGPRVPADRSRSHSARFSTGFRQSSRANWALSYGYRRAEGQAAGAEEQDHHEGGLSFDLQASRAVRMTLGTGLRTERLRSETFLLRYAHAVLSATGDVRPGISANAGFAHATNWFPSLAPFSIQSAQGGLRARVFQGLDLTENLVVSSNGDTAARDARVVVLNSIGLRAQPWRSLEVGITDQLYRAGPGLARATASSRTSALEIRWRPWSTLELSANRTRTGLLPRNDPRTSSLVLGLRWSAAAFQLQGSYARTEETRRSAQASGLSGREFMDARAVIELGRATTLTVGIGVAEPGRGNESRQMDALISKGFGR